MNNDLIAAMNQFFELVHADTEELRMQVYFLRYQVYVLETGFESDSVCRIGTDKDGHTLFLEQDVFDERSDHYLLRHRRSGIYAATARLILPNPSDVSAPYPIELHCPLDAQITDANMRAQLGEISRFAVSKDFKRRIGELGTLSGVAENVAMYCEENERRLLPHVSLGLFAAVMHMVQTNRINQCYAVMEPALLRLLSRFDVNFNRIGPNVDYHGIRVPCITTADQALPSIKRAVPSMWDTVSGHGELFREVA